MMDKTNTRRDAGTWREIVDRQVQSGSTVAEFCQREGLSVASFYGWRSKLRQKSDAGSGSVAVTEKPRQSESNAGGFIDLGALGVRYAADVLPGRPDPDPVVRIPL